LSFKRIANLFKGLWERKVRDDEPAHWRYGVIDGEPNGSVLHRTLQSSAAVLSEDRDKNQPIRFSVTPLEFVPSPPAAGHYSRRIQVQATATLPDGWSFACALQSSTDAGVTTFEPAALDVLMDSPIFAGRYFRRIELDDEGLVRLNIVADSADLLAATPEQIAPHRALVAQADRLFGARLGLPNG
jgi:Peptidase M61 N-terminal domain